MIPTWLRRHLNDIGVTTAGFTRRARLATCDLAPLSNLGEAIATLQDRMTFDLAYRGGRLELDDRDDFHIKGSPPETPDNWRAESDVLAAHRCNTPPLPAIESRIP